MRSLRSWSERYELYEKKIQMCMFLTSYTPLFLILFIKVLSHISEQIRPFIELKFPEIASENITFLEATNFFGIEKIKYLYF